MRLNWKRASWGALIGIVLGTFLVEHRVRELAAEQGQVAPTGLNPVPYMYSYHFWFFLLVFTIFCCCVLGFIGAVPAILALDEPGQTEFQTSRHHYASPYFV